MNRAVPLTLGLALVGALGVVAHRVQVHERGVHVTQSDRARDTGGTVELVRARAELGDTVVVEACSAALLANPPPPVRFEIELPTGAPLVQPLDAPAIAAIRRGARFGCLVIGRIESLRRPGTYGLRVVGQANAPFVGRILTRAPFTPLDSGLLVAVLLLAAAVMTTAHLRDAPPQAEGDRSPRALAVTLAIALGSLGLGFGAAAVVPFGGAAGAFTRGLVLAAAQTLPVLFVLARGRIETDAFGLVRASALPANVAIAFVLGFGLRIAEGYLQRVLAPTGVSEVATVVLPSLAREHVETVLDSHAGLLAFATVGLMAPLVEELFFRGLVFGAVARSRGAVVAGLVSVVVFVGAHAPQVHGQPAAVASLVLLASIAAWLRARSGTILVPYVMHTTHNAVIAAIALNAALR